MRSPKSGSEAGEARAPAAKKPARVNVLGGTARPLWSTIKMAFTAAFRRKPITVMYPYDRIELPKAYRGQHSIDWYKCIGCELCAKVCPNECIYFDILEVEKDSPYLKPSRAMLDDMKHVIRRPGVDVGHCLFCGNCMEYCPTDAWNFTQEFELADYTREDLYYAAPELKMPDEVSDKKTVLVNRIGEHPTVEVDVCIGCRKCERECPTRCIDMIDGPNLRKGKPIVVPEFDYDRCIGCQQCVDVCPVDCLHMEEVGHKSMQDFVHIDRVTAGTPVLLLEEAVAKRR